MASSQRSVSEVEGLGDKQAQFLTSVRVSVLARTTRSRERFWCRVPKDGHLVRIVDACIRHQYGHGALRTSDCPIKMFHSVSGNYTAARMELISVHCRTEMKAQDDPPSLLIERAREGARAAVPRREVSAKQKFEIFLQAGVLLIPQQSRHSPALARSYAQNVQGLSDGFLLFLTVGWRL